MRRVRRRNAGNRDALLQAINKHLAGRVEVTGDGAGAHVVLWPKKHISENSVIEKAAARGVGIYGISGYFLTRPSRQGLLLGYSRMKKEEIHEGIQRLSEIV